MAADSHPKATSTNGITPSPVSNKPIQLSIPLPNSPNSRIYIHLTLLATSLTLFLTSSNSGSNVSSVPLGSLVYAMPDRYNPTQPLSTPLYTDSSTQDFATRLAKVLARRTGQAAYVSSSISFSGAGNGGTVEEEMEGFRRVVETVLGAIEKAKAQAATGEEEGG